MSENSIKKYFSHRMNLEKDKTIQIGIMDNDLRNRIWNCLYDSYFMMYLGNNQNYPIVYDGFFKEVLTGSYNSYDLQNKFLSLEWHKVYSFIEFVLSKCTVYGNYIGHELNQILEEESAGYRLINFMITPITNEEEILEIDSAMSTKISSVNTHIKSALAFLSDRKNPDPDNSIKESISALEALLRKAANSDSLDLRRALKSIMRDSNSIDQNIISAILNLYTFTNDSSGVRHSHADTKNEVTLDDARFVLIICSAIVNYLITKKIGIL